MAKSRAVRSKKIDSVSTTTSIPESYPVDAPLVSAATEEKVPNWKRTPVGETVNGVVQQAPVPTDRPVRVYADGKPQMQRMHAVYDLLFRINLTDVCLVQAFSTCSILAMQRRWSRLRNRAILGSPYCVAPWTCTCTPSANLL